MSAAPERVEQAHMAVKQLAEAVHDTRPKHHESRVWSATSTLNPRAVQSALWNSSFGSILLQDGDSLSEPYPTKEYPDLNLHVGWSNIRVARLHSLVDFAHDDPDQWSHELDIRLSYTNDHYTATQSITAFTASYDASVLPTLERIVYSEEYIKRGYAGHSHEKYPQRTASDILGFVALAQQLFDTRLKED